MSLETALLASGIVPDALIRRRIRRYGTEVLAVERTSDPKANRRRHEAFVDAMRRSPIALHADDAPYVPVPARFYELCLGPRLKFSSALYPTGRESLAEAEEAMLALTAERARLADGQEILDLGCGWGPLTLFLAERYPRARILAVTNAPEQRRAIEARAAARGLGNVDVCLADVNVFTPGDRRFDRVVSVELFEHVRNWEALLGRIAAWLRPAGSVFVHVFCHRDAAYPLGARAEDDWMARNFHPGAMMPSDRLLYAFPEHLVVKEHWRVGGRHYARTAEAWLGNLDRNRAEARGLLAALHGSAEATSRFVAWRIFFLVFAETFGFRDGSEWHVSHYRLEPRDPSRPPPSDPPTIGPHPCAESS